MSEENKKKERSSSEIQSEYQLLCAKAGHLQYSVGVMKQDIERINAALRDLNNEHFKAKERDAAAKAEEESVKLDAVAEEVKS